MLAASETYTVFISGYAIFRKYICTVLLSYWVTVDAAPHKIVITLLDWSTLDQGLSR